MVVCGGQVLGTMTTNLGESPDRALTRVGEVTMRRTTKEALEQLLPDIMTTCLRRGGRADRRAEFTI